VRSLILQTKKTPTGKLLVSWERPIANSGGLVEGLELQVNIEETAPTDAYGQVITMKKNNPDTVGKSTGIFLTNGGAYAMKKAVDITGAFVNGIVLEDASLSEYVLRLPLEKALAWVVQAKQQLSLLARA
jgi:hypothetical protein